MNLRMAAPGRVAGLIGAVLCFGLNPDAAIAQGAAASMPMVAAADYARAETFLAAATAPLIVGGTVNATWLPDDRFVYRSNTGGGQSEFLLVDPVAKTRVPAFDHVRLATALAAASATKVDAAKLPFTSIALSADARLVSFDLADKRYTCDVAGTACSSAASTRDPNAVVSPDGTRAVFIKD